MKKLILFLFIFILLLFGLFFVVEKVLAGDCWWPIDPEDVIPDWKTEGWRCGILNQTQDARAEPIPDSQYSICIDNITFSGTITLPVCNNWMSKAKLDFYIRGASFQEGIEPAWTKLGDWSWDGSQEWIVEYSATFPISFGAYVGPSEVIIDYYLQAKFLPKDDLYYWGSTIVPIEIVSLGPEWPSVAPGETQIIVKARAYGYGFNTGYKRNPYPEDDLFCEITEPTTVSYPGGQPIKYTYEWYKNGVRQDSLTKSDTTDLDYTISPTTSVGETWKCKVTPKDNFGTTGPFTEYIATIVSSP